MISFQKKYSILLFRWVAKRPHNGAALFDESQSVGWFDDANLAVIRQLTKPSIPDTNNLETAE